VFWKRKAKKKSEAEADAAVTTVEDAEEAADASSDEESAQADTGSSADASDGAEKASEAGDGSSDSSDLSIERVEMAGTLEVDGEEYEVVTNTWIVQIDEDGVVVVNPGEDAKAILEKVGDREIYLVACTNGYRPHIAGAVEVAERDEAPIALHPKELRRWRKVHGVEHSPEIEAEGGGKLTIGDVEVEILPTPGTAPGSLSYYFPHIKAVCSGDTLLAGKLGTVGDGYMDYTSQLASVGEVLLALPEETRVLPSTGEETTIAEESKNFDSWVLGE
jgi:glyoxylase-like metal-dependent hydrolase (beta-lactamase superfamily II)